MSDASPSPDPGFEAGDAAMPDDHGEVVLAQPGAGRGGPGSEDLDVDVRSFLPEGTSISEQPTVLEQSPVSAAEAVPEPNAGDSGDPIDLTVLSQIEADLAAVDAALAALDDGTYATCSVCAGPIDGESLAADPVRRSCRDHRTSSVSGSAEASVSPDMASR